MSNEALCKTSPQLLAVPGTTKMNRAPLPTHYQADPAETGLPAVTRFKCENLTNIEKASITAVSGRISRLEYMKLQQCLCQAFHLEPIEW